MLWRRCVSVFEAEFTGFDSQPSQTKTLKIGSKAPAWQPVLKQEGERPCVALASFLERCHIPHTCY